MLATSGMLLGLMGFYKSGWSMAALSKSMGVILLGVSFSFKSEKLMLILLTMESLTLLLIYFWTSLSESQSLANQSLLVFFLIGVSEGCLGVSLMVLMVRSQGNEQLKSL